MVTVHREDSNFLIRFDTQDPYSGNSQTSYLSFTWRDANDIQTALSQLLLDYEIERGAYPVADDPDHLAEIHRTGDDPF